MENLKGKLLQPDDFEAGLLTTAGIWFPAVAMALSLPANHDSKI